MIFLGLAFVMTAQLRDSRACDAFLPHGELLRSKASIWFTDLEGKTDNLAVIFRSYDEDGDRLADFETVTRIFKDRGEEPFPFLYSRGKDVPFTTPGEETVYVMVAEEEYIDIEATGKCENILRIEKRSQTSPEINLQEQI